MRPLRFGFLALACVACSTTPAITLSATPNPLPGDGLTKATVTAVVTEGGSPSQSATVHFKTSLGVFDGAGGTGQIIDATTDDQGRTIATFAAPRQGFGSITVSASVSLQGVEPSASVAIPLAAGGGMASSISFTCATHNIGALVFNRQTDVHMLCRATAVDASNRPIKNASVQTLSEAGSLDWLDDSNGVQEFVYTVRPDDKPPRDVMPLGTDGREQDACPTACNLDPFGGSCRGEPCWTDATGVTHNPRDGVVALVAAAPAHGYDDQGEPYADLNDNGAWDPGEPFIDYDGNGKWDGPDGALKDHMVWRVFRVIWSGEAATPPQGQGTNHSSYMTVDKRDLTVTAHFVDRNLNALAADGSSGSDAISFSVGTCTGDASITLTTEGLAMDQTNPGILFSADTGAISAKNSRSSYTRNTDYTNGYSITGGGSCPVIATPARTYDPGAPGYEASGDNPDNGVLAMVAP